MVERDVTWEYEYRFRQSLRGARDLCLVGVIVAFIGFLPPWFSPGGGPGWWYGGWSTITQDGPWWGLLVAVGYALLMVGCFTMQMRSRDGASAMVVMDLIVVFGTALVVGFALARAASRAQYIDSMSWGIGLLPLLAGLAMMTWGAISAASLWQMARVVTTSVE